MDTLILSCSTGGGHNHAAAAVKEELMARGHRVVMLDPFTLVGHNVANAVGEVYIKTAQKIPVLFGLAYLLAELVRRIPGKSPVYFANARAAKRLGAYLKQQHFDAVIMTHLFPAEMITWLKRHGEAVHGSVFIATDYTCIPFTEETDCDYYIIPGEKQFAAFENRGIPADKLKPLGIPVSGVYFRKGSREKARSRLGLKPDEYCVLLTGGSIGAGSLEKSICILKECFRERQMKGRIIVVCGNNRALYRRLRHRYGTSEAAVSGCKVIVVGFTRHMSEYMNACDLFISKPGGLSSTEAAVTGVPYIQISPIPGCEIINMNFFSGSGMSIGVFRPERGLREAFFSLQKEEAVKAMKEAQARVLPEQSLIHICDWLESLGQRSSLREND